MLAKLIQLLAAQTGRQPIVRDDWRSETLSKNPLIGRDAALDAVPLFDRAASGNAQRGEAGRVGQNV